MMVENTYTLGAEWRKTRSRGRILNKKDPNILISEADICTPRVMALHIIIQGFKLRVINAYSPTNIDGTQHQKDDFYKTLEKAL